MDTVFLIIRLFRRCRAPWPWRLRSREGLGLCRNAQNRKQSLWRNRLTAKSLGREWLFFLVFRLTIIITYPIIVVENNDDLFAPRLTRQEASDGVLFALVE